MIPLRFRSCVVPRPLRLQNRSRRLSERMPAALQFNVPLMLAVPLKTFPEGRTVMVRNRYLEQVLEYIEYILYKLVE